MKSMNPPTTVNKIYRLAGVWVKPTARAETGTGATYHMEQKKMQQKEEGKTEEDKKPQKDLSKVMCYGCGKPEERRKREETPGRQIRIYERHLV